MNREEAIYYLKSSGMSDEQIKSVIDAFICEDYISRQEALKVMCDNCPMYNCVCGCSSYRHIERMESVTPQPKTDVLDKIRAEIEALEEGITNYHNDRPWIFKDEVLKIIDKYKAESEE